MIPTKELSQEIRQYYDNHADEVLPISRVVHELIRQHAKPNGPDGDWWESAGYVAIWYLATGVNRAIKGIENGQEAEQGELYPGYKRLQKRYSIIRGEEWCLVPVGQLTDDELNEKIKEHRGMAAGHELHALELERFRDDRNTH